MVCAVALLVLTGEWRPSLAEDTAAALRNNSDVEAVGMDHGGGRVATSGTGVPLRHALELILPTDYSINLPNAGAWADTPITWHAGRSVIQTLQDALQNHPELVVQIDGELHLVTVRSRHPFSEPPAVALNPPPAANPAPPMKPVANQPATLAAAPADGTIPIAGQAPVVPAQASKTSSTVVPVILAVSGPAAASPVATAPPPQQVWRMEVSDKTVRTALARWAHEAGWQLMWDAPVDFSLDASATVHGTFEEALQSVVDALASSSTPIQAVLYRGNKVLRIVPKGAG